MKRKERVVVFDGEDKFISPRRNPQEPQMTPEGTAFKKYMADKNAAIEMPSPTDEKFCEKAEAFIKTNCNGKATPEQLWEVYENFQKYCLKPEEEKKADGDGTPPPTEQPAPTNPQFPDWETLDCETLPAEIKKLEDTLLVARLPMDILSQYRAAIERGKQVQAQRCGITPPALPDITTAPGGVKFVQLGTPKLGLPPAKGGEAENQPAKKEKENSSTLLIVLLGLLALYLITDKKD